MPCDSITTQSINLSNADHSVLLDALNADNWNIRRQSSDEIVAYKRGQTLTWNKGTGIEVKSMSNADKAILDVTKAYSKQAVSWASQRAGWKVKSINDNQFQVTRR